MRTAGIEGCHNGKAQVTTRPGPNSVAADDLVRRNFTADRPDAVWLSDFTYIRTWEGWSYLAIVLDIHTRRIVGWQVTSHMRQSLVTDAFEMANASRIRHEGGLIAHWSPQALREKATVQRPIRRTAPFESIGPLPIL